MRTGEAAQQFNVSSQTVRDWLKEFSEFCSEQKGSQIFITNDDFKVLATVAELRQTMNHDEIHAKLKDGYRTEDLEDYVMPTDMMIPLKTAVDTSRFTAEIEILKAEKDHYMTLLEDEKQHHEKDNQEYQARIDALQVEIRQLSERAASAETEAKMLREQQDKKRRWF